MKTAKPAAQHKRGAPSARGPAGQAILSGVHRSQIGLCQSGYRDLKNDKHDITLSQLEKLANFLGKTVHDFLPLPDQPEERKAEFY